MSELVQRVVEAEMRRQSAVIDAACSAALVAGCGVKVVRDQSGTKLVSAEPDETVPYGEIHEHHLDTYGASFGD